MRCKFHSALFPPAPLLSDLPSQPFPPISVLLFPTSSFLYLRPPVPLFLKSSRGSPLSCRRAPRQNYRDRLARADTLFRGSSRFSRGKSSASRRRRGWPRGDLSRMRRSEPGRADGAERNGGGEASAELINSDGLLSTRPFERQRVVTSVFVEGRSLRLWNGGEPLWLDAAISTEQSSIQ